MTDVVLERALAERALAGGDTFAQERDRFGEPARAVLDRDTSVGFTQPLPRTS